MASPADDEPASDTDPDAARTTLAELRDLVRRFTDARDWAPFHTPKNLALALVCEVGELLEHCRYRSDDQVARHLDRPEARREFAHELADCLWLLLRLADVVDVDLALALREKLRLADRKYPVDRCKGRPDKYTAYILPPGSDPDPDPDPLTT